MQRGGQGDSRLPGSSAPTSVESGGPDLLYLAALGALISVGIIMYYSTNAVHGEARDYLKLAGGLMGGAIFMWAGARLPIAVLRRFSIPLLFLCALALLSLKVPGAPWAVTTNGATRWIALPGGLTVQPSEFTKFAVVLFAAGLLERAAARMNRGAAGDWALFLGVLGGLAGIIYKEPDLGTALVLGGTAFCMLLSAGIDFRKLFLGVVILAVTVFGLAWNTDHQRARLLAWRDPWAEEHRQEGGYQVIRSWVAMARGGLFGVGLGQSTMKLDNRLPESETDFIFAIVAEEMGLLRAVGVLILFGLLIWRGFAIAARAPDRYSALVVAGFTSWVAVQSCLNVAVVTGTVPNTGVPLPFISSGLSSLVSLLAAAGVVVGVSQRGRPLKPKPKPR